MKNNGKLLNVTDLKLYFRTKTGLVQAVDGVDFELTHNRAVVILGESGCGKSSLAKAILRLLPRNVADYTGSVRLDGEELMTYNEETFRYNIRWAAISMVPQAAMNALNPVIRVGEQVAEPAMVHLDLKREDAYALVHKMFKHVGVPQDFISRYPFELSGGMRQRVAIAMALITSPKLIILDEPTSALDVLTQANIMNVLKEIKNTLGTSYMLITHDIATSSELADDVAAMYAGQVVEMSDADSFFNEPLHPYSQKLMASVPRLREETQPDFITGQPPSLINPPTGCRFYERCHKRVAVCDQAPPVFKVDERKVRCWLYAS